MHPFAKILVGTGVLLIVVGLLWPVISRLGLGRLPGDIAVERENFKFYFPVATSILLSVVLSVVLYLVRKFWG